MKKLRILLVLMIAFIVSPVYAATFEPSFDIDTEIDGDKIYLKLGIGEQYMQAVTGYIKYDASKIKLTNVVGINGYTATVSDKEEKDGKFNIIKYEADSDEDHKDENFMELTFTIDKSFKVGKTADIFFYDYEIGTSGLKKYRDEGVLMTLNRVENKMVLYNLEENNDELRTRLWFINHLYIFIIIVLIIIGGIVAILVAPSKRKVESRQDNIRESKKNGLRNDNVKNFAAKEEYVKEGAYVVDSPFKDSESKFKEEKKEEEDPLSNLRSDVETLPEEEPVLFDPELDNVKIEEHYDDKITSIVLVLIIASVAMFMGVAHASFDEMYELRDCVVGNTKYSKEYDLNKDHKCDVLDLVLGRRIYMTMEYNPDTEPVYTPINDGNSVDING